MPDAIQISPMTEVDLVDVAALSAQLGYPTDLGQVTERFHHLLPHVDSGMFVAKRRRVVGWIHVYGVRLLETDGYAEVGGIVVSEAFRRQGVGQLLIRAGEQWASDQGYKELRLRSGVHRDAAHKFYESVGYEKSKASYMFRKDLDN